MRLDNYFKDSNVSRGNSISALDENYKRFLGNINISEWARERELEINTIVVNRDYSKAIRIFNNKGLNAIANSVFGIKDFNERAVALLKKDSNLRTQLLTHFPSF
jgi:hypothetical protein